MKIKSVFFPVDKESEFDSFESFDEYADEYSDKSGVIRNTGLESYTINKKYDDDESPF